MKNTGDSFFREKTKHFINNFNMQVDVLFINKNHHYNTIVNELLY